MTASVTSERKSLLPSRLRSTTVLGSNRSIPTIMSRSTTAVSTSMSIDNDFKSTLTIGNRVLVNGLKKGTLRYIGVVQFAQGVFCGVELDEPEGKHDGQVNNVRYFQCKTNHGVFVPREKVVLTTRERSYTIQRTNTITQPHLKPLMTRSMTISSSSSPLSSKKIGKNSIKPWLTTSVHLPDIIPNKSTSESNPIDPPKITEHSFRSAPSNLDEPLEADFTDSVSLILHQLQQDQKPLSLPRCNSYTISEEGSIDDLDDDDDDDDNDENQSLVEVNLSERRSIHDQLLLTKAIQTDLSFDINENVIIRKTNLLNTKSLSYSNKSLANSTTSINSTKKPSLPPASAIKKDSERKLSVPIKSTRKPSLPASTTSRQASLVPPKKPLSTTLFGSQSKLNQSCSTSNLDLTLVRKKVRGSSFSISLDKNSDAIDDHQLAIQKLAIQSLESTNKQLKSQYQHIVNRFDLMYILNRFYINQNEQIKTDYELQFSKLKKMINKLKTSLEETKFVHENQLETICEQHKIELQSVKNLSNQYQENLAKLTKENQSLEIRCRTLQAEVDRFYDEMKNSQYADPLLRRVDTLEKDRNSLETALEIKTQELSQLRIQMNEQVFEREDQFALQKKLEMVEHRNQDLLCLLRNWQLNEIAATVERDELKEQLAQLERVNRQLIFENETLLYGIRQRSTTVACMSIVESHSIPRPVQNLRKRAQSFSSLSSNENQRIQRTYSIGNLHLQKKEE